MPSALEKLVKILKLEQEQGNKNTAVIGGLKNFADHWVPEAHAQAKKPEHHALVDELAAVIAEYGALASGVERGRAIKHMLDRITGRVPPRPMAEAKLERPEEEFPPRQPVGAREKKRDKGEKPIRREPSRGPLRPPRPLRSPRAPVDLEEALENLRGLEAPITVLHRVGPSMAEKLGRLDVRNVGDMLFLFPRRYDDFTRMKPISQLLPGETVTIIGSAMKTRLRTVSGGRRLVEVTFSDGSATITVSWFNQPWLKDKFRRGTQLVLSGKVELYLGRPTMTNPEWEPLERELLHAGGIVPIYPLTRGLTARTMRRLMKQTVTYWAKRIPDYVPPGVLERADLVDLDWALTQIHFPHSWEALERARTRIVFDELLLLQMGVLAHRREWQSVPGRPLPVEDKWLEAFTAALPYALTGAQKRALNEIRTDMAGNVPMNRLLQGDVGSGKTVVAAIAMGIALTGGAQAALMAPTGILTEQHFQTISRLLAESPLGETINLRLLTGATPDTERTEIYAGLADGSINVVIGTHALIQSGVEFASLGLVVIDEQHRFGVEQRGRLRGKGTNPHLLVMTATPIPRTLALTVYADLDLSIIDEMPPGRTPVETRVLLPQERERAFAFIRHEIAKGGQAFIIYPLVEGEDEREKISAVRQAEFLQKEVFPNQKLGLLHGRLHADEKDTMMAAFARGEIDILVATSVVEVGIDVPNASVMLIEGAERFGLAQLHQFRGRVGRGEHPSYCLLVTDQQPSEEGLARLQAMEDTTDGFKLAETDWQMRGPGELLGTRQAGVGILHLTELMNPRLVELAQREARTLYAEDADLALPEHALLARRVRQLQTTAADIS
jgi:ATP-dependent DNA helicase RecG